MKKDPNPNRGIQLLSKKISRIMKLYLFILVITVMQATATSVYSQTARLNLKMENATIAEVFDAVEKQSDFFFFYNKGKINDQQRVTVDLQNSKIDEVLTTVFGKNAVSYEIIGKNIIVKPIELSDATSGQQSNKKVTGKVTDQTGTSIPGVSIVVKGTTVGITTDINGGFSLSVPTDSKVLIFSFIGMKTQEIPIGNKASFNVTMNEEAIGIDEVVAIGYGTQKKVNLTGSIATVSTKDLESRPITQASQALAGLANGVSVSQGSGAPGGDGAEIRVRGIGTFSNAGKDPLVLIDGLAASINEVDPNNIKSVSVLKDAASAAIYGNRAANGVILIETKRGEKGKLQVSYNSYVGWQKVTALPDFLNSSEYATMQNVANPNTYTADQIAKYKDGSDPDNYPNVPHLKNLLNTGSGFQTNHNLNFMGGDEKNSYLFSLGYLNQNGLLAKNDFSKYNFGLNFDSKIKENLKLKVDLSGYSQNTDEPRSTGDMQSMIGYAVREGPIYAGKKSDGTYGYQDDFAPEAWMSSQSFTNRKAKNFMGGMELSWEIVKGLTLSEKAGYKYYAWTDQWYQSTFVFDASKTVGPNKLNL
jgi:TonB-linked SusC/RagA family outer membrane protein